MSLDAFGMKIEKANLLLRESIQDRLIPVVTDRMLLLHGAAT